MQRRSVGVQGLVFGALMAALIVVFSLVPFLAVFMPIPLVLAYVRYGGRVATMTAAVATIFTMAFSGFLAGLLAIPGGILPGLIFGYGFRHKWRPLTIGIVAVVVFFLGFGMEYGLTRVAMFGGNDPFEAALASPTGRAQLERSLDLMERAMVPQVPNPTPQQEQVIAQSQAMIDAIRRDPVGFTWALLPTALFLFGVFSTWMNYQLCRITLPRFGHQVPAPTPFEEFRLPLWVVWAYGILMLAAPFFFTTDLVGAGWWAKLLLNIFTPLGLVVGLAGIAVAYGFLRKKGYSKGVSALMTGLGFLLLGQAALQVFLLIAMWDTIFDFRGLGHGMWKRPEEST